MNKLLIASVASVALGASACSMAAGLTRSSTTSRGTGPSPRTGVATASEAGSTTPNSGPLIVPDVMGKTLDEAQAIVRAAGFTTEVEVRAGLSCENAARVKDRINCQSPDPGTHALRGGWIQVAVYKPWAHPNMLIRDQLLPLIGMTVEQARKRLKELGHDGEVTIDTVLTYQASCGQNKICTIHSEAGFGIHDEARLSINPKVEIAAPPP